MFLTILISLLFVVNCVSKKPQVDTSNNAVNISQSVLLTHPRFIDICQIHMIGKEGASIKNFQLQKVFIATTSGLRTPFIHKRQSSLFDPEEQSYFCIYNNSTKRFQPEQVQDYLRTLSIKQKVSAKASKSSFKMFYSQSPETKRCQGESLSSFGVTQLINLGKYLLSSYFGKLKSLNSILLPPGFAATFGDETLFHSLHALLFGLLSEKQFVHMHIEKSHFDFSKSSQSVLGYKDLHYFVEQAFAKENHLFKDKKFMTVERSHLIDSFFGQDVSSKEVVGHLSNSLCSTSIGMPVKTVNITYQDVSDIFNESDFYNSYLTSSPTFQSYAVARTFSFRQLIKNWLFSSMSLNEDTDTNRDLKIVTVDDLFLFSFLTAINIPVSLHAPPSSRLIIESFKSPLVGHIFPTAHLQSGRFTKVGNISLKFQEEKNSQTRGSKKMLKSNDLSERHDLYTVLHSVNQEENVSSEKLQASIPLISPSLRLSKEHSDKTDNGLGSDTSQSSPFYVRVLYNGEVVTSNIPGCKGDPMISLGLCSIETVKVLLDLTDLNHYPIKNEL